MKKGLIYVLFVGSSITTTRRFSAPCHDVAMQRRAMAHVGAHINNPRTILHVIDGAPFIMVVSLSSKC